MTDRIETLGASLVQHGKHNDRAYLMKASADDLPGLVDRLDELAREHGYSKIFAKVGGLLVEPFLVAGYREEAVVPGFYRGEENGYFLGKYPEPARAEEPDPERVDEVRAAWATPPGALSPLEEGFELKLLGEEHLERLAALYAEVFASYPFPIQDPEFLREAMALGGTAYYGVLSGEELVAASSAEMDAAGSNAEMTDFATLPVARRKGLAGHLLTRMHADMAERGIRTLYTIARARSFGMNLTFARLGYRFAGTLVANTQIMGQFESMNVWWRRTP